MIKCFEEKSKSLKSDGYLVVDNFLDKESINQLAKDVTELDYTPFISEDPKMRKKIVNQNLGDYFIWSLETGEKLYLKSKTLPIGTPVKNYPDTIFPIISLYQDKIMELLERQGYPVHKITRLASVPCMWPEGSSLDWHNDGRWDLGLTLYVTPNWSQECCGVLMTKKGKCIEGGDWIFPELNRFFCVLGKKVKHKVNPIMKGCPPRYTIQTYCSIEDGNYHGFKDGKIV